MLKKLVAETLQESYKFQRGLDPKAAMKIGANISIVMPTYIATTKDGKIDLTDEDAKYFLEVAKKNNIKLEVLGSDDNYTDIKLTGLKEDFPPLLMLYDAHGRDLKDLRRVLKKWSGDEEELTEILF